MKTPESPFHVGSVFRDVCVPIQISILVQPFAASQCRLWVVGEGKPPPSLPPASPQHTSQGAKRGSPRLY